MSLAMKARQRVKKKTVKDKIFGCDLLEHLRMSGQEVPQVVKSCAEFVEEHGIVDGIYRLCGIASNVQKLRQEFDIERPPDLHKSTYLQDVHCVSSLCKAYFRELPNPLLTYQLYDMFADAVAIQLEEQRLIKIREVLQQLPLPHYRTLEYLMRHLLRMASYSSQTNMHTRNLAIVWAPNLLRSKDIESSGFNGTAAFMEVRVQSIVVEFILNHVEQLFGDWTSNGKEHEGSSYASTKWSMPTCVPEDYYRSLSYNLPNMLNHGDGPPQIRPYHTIIDLTDHRRKGSLKGKKWKSIFNLGRSNPDSKRKSHKQEDRDGKLGKLSLRPAKSMDSLSSVPHATHGTDLDQNNLALCSPRNPLSLRRESLGSPTKEENVEFLFLDSEEPRSMDTNETEYEGEEEGQAKSEPTTPKSERSLLTGNPPGRSPKSNPSRAEKCVGVHISGPFSVTLPFHITSNLSRLTRGMECPGLSISAPHRGPNNFSLEGNLSVEPEDKDKARPSQVSDKESDKHSETNETEEPGRENARISLEVQDTFSFLDAQDTSVEKIAEITMDNEMLGYDLHALNKMEEFSVEPPPEDLEDEAGQTYFMPIGFVDQVGHWQVMQDSLEDIYLSAHDDLSPITQKPETNLQNLEPSSEEHMDEYDCIVHENCLTDPGEETLEEDQLRTHGVPYTQEKSQMALETQCNAAHNIVVDDHDGQCKDHSATDEHEESGPPTNEEEATIVQPRYSQGHNMGIPNSENREDLPDPEEMQQDDPHHKDHVETVNGQELDSPGAPVPERAETDTDYTELQHHRHPMQGDGVLEAPETSQEQISCVTDLNNAPSKAAMENEDGKVTYSIPDSYDEGGTAPKNTTDNCLSRNIPSPEHEEMVKLKSNCNEGGSAEDPESIAESQSFSDDDPQPEESVGHDDLPDQTYINPPEEYRKGSLQQEEPAHFNTNETDVTEQRPPPVSSSNVPNRMYPDGSVAMKLTATTNKIQHIRSVPVVPPKPQFAKLPPALKSKIQVSSSSSPHPLLTSEKVSHMDPAETSTCTSPESKLQISSSSSPHPLLTSEKFSHMDTAETSTCTSPESKLQISSSSSPHPLLTSEKFSHMDTAETSTCTSPESKLQISSSSSPHPLLTSEKFSHMDTAETSTCTSSESKLQVSSSSSPHPLLTSEKVSHMDTAETSTCTSPESKLQISASSSPHPLPTSEKVSHMDPAETSTCTSPRSKLQISASSSPHPLPTSEKVSHMDPAETSTCTSPRSKLQVSAASSPHPLLTSEKVSHMDTAETSTCTSPRSKLQVSAVSSPHPLLTSEKVSHMDTAETSTCTSPRSKLQVSAVSSPHPLLTSEKVSHMDPVEISTCTSPKSKLQVSASSSPRLLPTSEKVSHMEPAETSTCTSPKSKIQVSSLLSKNRDPRSQMSEKTSHTEAAETSIDIALIKRSSWRNTTSVSFDTAMARAKERQSQNPVRRMQTYCIGDSYDLMDTSKPDNAPHAPRFTVKSASSRTHRPFSCMSNPCGEGELLGPEGKETVHGLKSIFTHEPDAYSKELPNRNRLSMPKLGQASVGDDQCKCHQQRRSLL